jgi:hypothetical protein
MRVPLRRPSAATVISCLALFVALGGTGYAAVSLPRGSVGTAQLRDGAVVSSKVRDGSLAARHFAPGELPSTTLPAGRTLRGAYVLGSSSAAGSQLAVGEISFAFPLQRAPRAHFMAAGTKPPSACPGSAARPAAAAGHLCIYEARNGQAGEHRVLDPLTGETEGTVRPWGAGLSVRAIRGGDVFSAGTWAVTAPA